MRKKILDVAVVFCFTVMLGASSNIQEAEELPAEEKGEITVVRTETSSSSYSFTPESDEKTSIEKNNVIWVTSAYYSSSSNEVKESKVIEDEDEANEEKQNTEKQNEVQDVTAEAAPVCENRWNIQLTEEEIDLLAKIVWVESRGEPVMGQQAVVEVVFNRMASAKYPNTLYEVLSQREPVQFCSWKLRDTAEPTEKEYDSIYSVLNGNTQLLRNDTMYFSTFPLTEHVEIKIENHYFCY